MPFCDVQSVLIETDNVCINHPSIGCASPARYTRRDALYTLQTESSEYILKELLQLSASSVCNAC